MNRVLLPRRPLLAPDGRRRVRQLSRASRLSGTRLIAVGCSTTHPLWSLHLRPCETLFQIQMASVPAGVPRKILPPVLCWLGRALFRRRRVPALPRGTAHRVLLGEDVHVTGTLAARANLTHTPLGSLELSREQVEYLLGSRDNRSEIGVFLFGPPDLSLTEIRRLRQVVQDRRSASGQAALQEQTPQVPSL